MGRIQQRLRRIKAMAGATLHDPRRRGLDLVFVEPCYWLINRLNADSVILDCGLGCDADFSQAMIRRFGMTSHGFDPTRRHHPALRQVAASSGGRFVLHEVAIGPTPGTITFHESQENVSGSMLADHPNVLRDNVQSYEVPVITIPQAIAMTPAGRADLIKMDIEGPEYAILESLSDDVIRATGQWLIDFHHDLMPGFSFQNTRDCARRFQSLGFRVYTRDNVDFLFYRL